MDLTGRVGGKPAVTRGEWPVVVIVVYWFNYPRF